MFLGKAPQCSSQAEVLFAFLLRDRILLLFLWLPFPRKKHIHYPNFRVVLTSVLYLPIVCELFGVTEVCNSGRIRVVSVSDVVV